MALNIALQTAATIAKECKVEQLTADLLPSSFEGAKTPKSLLPEAESRFEINTPVGGVFLKTNLGNPPVASKLGNIEELNIGAPKQVGLGCQVGITAKNAQGKILESFRLEYDGYGVPRRQIVDTSDGTKLNNPMSIDVATEVKLPTDQLPKLKISPDGSLRPGENSKFSVQIRLDSGEVTTSQFQNSLIKGPIESVVISPAYRAEAGSQTLTFVQVTSFDKKGAVLDRTFLQFGKNGATKAIDTLINGEVQNPPNVTELSK